MLLHLACMVSLGKDSLLACGPRQVDASCCQTDTSQCLEGAGDQHLLLGAALQLEKDAAMATLGVLGLRKTLDPDSLTLLWTCPTPCPPQVHSSRHRTTADRSAVLPSNCRATICRWAHASHMGAAGACPWGALAVEAATRAACMQRFHGDCWQGGLWQGGRQV